MKRVRILTSILLAGAICLSGCEEAPTQTVDSSEGEKTVVTESEKYVSLAEAKEQVNQLKGNSVSDFTFSKNFEMPEIDSISVVKLKQYSLEDTSSVEQALSNIWDDYNGINWDEAEEQIFTHPDHENYIGISKEDAATGYWFSCDTFGFICGNSLTDSGLTMSSCKKTYDFQSGVNWEEIKNDKYMLKDGEITIGDAVTYVENKLNKYLVSVENNAFQYKVQKLSVMYDASAEICDFNMTVGRVYNGMDIATVSDFNPRVGIYYENIHCGTHILVTMRNINKIDYINNCIESFAVDSVEMKDSIISPFWAVQQIDEQVANIGGVSYGYCGLVYIITQKNSEYENNKQALYYRVNDGAYLKPYWIFSNKATSSAWASTTGDVLRQSVLVDAIDGTLYYYEGTGAY